MRKWFGRAASSMNATATTALQEQLLWHDRHIAWAASESFAETAKCINDASTQ